MSDSRICLKPISALLTDEQGHPTNYRIPSYQRGYRWSPLQVTQLLDDVWDFVQESEGGNRQQFYCLQPLVIKTLPNGAFEVVDGQQRLTTIYILLTYLKDIVTILGKTRFQITFETRGEANEPFLKDIDLARADENVDFFHICQAYRAVEGWFQNRDGMHKLKLLQHLLNDDEAGRNVKVIWFQLADSDNPVDAFTRLNVGKIPLTNDELIRALFLKRTKDNTSEVQSLQLRIASEWDQLEKALQSDSFWYFLNNQAGKAQNRIHFLFDLVARTDGLLPGAEHNEYWIFYAFSQKLKATGHSPEREWLKIKQTFMELEEWFEDRILYHIVGFLVSEGMSIRAIRELSKNCTKSKFEQKLRREAFAKTIDSQPHEDMGEETIRTHVAGKLEELEYGPHNGKIKSILLLFNLATLLQNRRSNLRFQFDSFKSERWNIEHIRSVTSDKPLRHSERIEWLKHCLGYLQSQEDGGPLRAEIEAFVALPSHAALETVFDPLYDKLLGVFHEMTDQETDNGIANLTLLDEGTNKSYKNAVFAVKRQRLLSLDRTGVFVSLCTRNVFLKCYSPRVGNVMFWTSEDRGAYQSAIIETLVGFFAERTAERI
jgi:hypothetical protein